MRRTIIIGDIHGCAREFRQLLFKLEYKKGSDLIYLTGDAFTKGPDPVGVWRLICDTNATMVLGNHDEKLLHSLRLWTAGSNLPLKSPGQQQTLEALHPLAGSMIPWLEALPLWIDKSDFVLVHAGINPEKGISGTSREEFIAIRTWPPVVGINGPRWHDAYDSSGKLIVFGHDAPRGLVIKRRNDGSPYIIGLDTGCVYGGQLSAYVEEEDRVEYVDRQ